ncbi:MAG: ATP-grasp domain-containing protein [Calditrichaeota bacterium]|nr:ATP-grasp domain-containing protein [Calditrichota bacterium]
MARILFLMPTKTYRASAFLLAAEKLALEVVVASERQQALESLTENKTLTLDFSNPDGASENIVAFATKVKLDAIIPVDEDTVVIAALALKTLGLPHNSPKSAMAAREKPRMRRLLTDAGLPSPDFSLVSIEDDFASVAREMSYPCVLKPTFLSSSRGVIRADDAGSFVNAANRISAILENLQLSTYDQKLAGQILVEDYIPGEEVALEGLLTEGHLKTLTIFDKPDPLTGPYFEETIYVTPSRHPESVQQRLRQAVTAAAQAMGIRHGPVHAEIRINQDRIWILEIAARSIGGLCARALRFENDMSLEELILLHAIGEDVGHVKREENASGVMMIPIPQKGTLRAVSGQKQALAVKHVDDIRITIPLSQEVVPMPEGNRYLGFIFARAETPQEVESALREGHRKLVFDIGQPCEDSEPSQG